MDKIYQGNSSAKHEGIQRSGPARRNPFEPAHLLRILMRRWIIILIAAVIGGGSGILYKYKARRYYKAEARLEMSVRRPKVINNDAVFEDNLWARDENVVFNTRFAKFKSPAMERLAAQEYFNRYPEDAVNGVGRDIGKYVLASLVRDVEWTRDPKANIVYVTYYNRDPEFAAKLVNVLTYCAGVLVMQENQTRSDEAVKWLVSQVDEQRGELDEVEGRLASIRQELQLDSLQQRKAALGQALITVTAEREQIISTLESRKTVFSYVLDLKESDPNLEMLPSGLPKEEQFNELIRAWRTANEELQLASGHYTTIHPEYKRTAEKEQRAHQRLEKFIETSAKAVENEIELQTKQLGQIEERIKNMEREAVDLEQQVSGGMRRLQRLERERDAADVAYQTMLRRMEEARLSADENMAFTNVIQNAEVPRIPIGPKTFQILLVGIFIGGIFGCVLVLVESFLTDKIETIMDLRAMNLNVLGSVPSVRKCNDRSDLAVIGLHDKFSRVVEVFSGVNALISSEKYANRTRVLLMSSSMPGEGKTISACNLAISSALNGSRTLLIDGDLRRPQLVNIFDIDEDHPSLLEWLHDDSPEITHHQLVARSSVENLDVITSCPVRDINPAELLGRSQLAELLEWSRSEYDRVIIDSPPLGPVGDAQVLVNYVDAVIMISRVGKTRRRALRFALARYKEVDAFVIGCIANDVPHSLAGMFGGAEGYGYGYGYGNAYKPFGKETA